MYGGWAVAGACVGLAAGMLLRPTVRRLSVPAAGAPPAPTAPPARAGRVSPGAWAAPTASTAPRAPTAAGSPLRSPQVWLLAPVTGMVLALLAGRYGPRPELVAFGWLAVAGVALAVVDLAVHRLPDRLVLPAYPVVLAALAVAAVVDRDPDRLVRAVAGGLCLVGCYLALALARPSQLGLGDVKLAGVLGLALGWAGWPALLLGSFLPFAAFAVCGLVLVATGRATRQTNLAFGPFMLCAALLVLLIS